jgi:hypothetical protein
MYHFTDYYFTALDSSEREDGNTPAVWLPVFNAAQSAEIHPLQNLILGANAHINYDLVLALSDLLATEWQELFEAQRQSRYRGHGHVNQIIFETIIRIQA